MDSIKLAKLASSLPADEALDRMVKATNDGNTGGRVNKSDLLSWIVLQFERQSFDRCLEKIREAHFDEVAYLESVVREIKATRKTGVKHDLAGLLAPLTSGKAASSIKKRADTAPEKSEGEKNSA